MSEDATPEAGDGLDPAAGDGLDPAAGDGLDPADRRAAVRERYAGIAADEAACGSACCDDSAGERDADARSRAVGYAEDELDAVASGANLGLGCGNPTALADLDAGETVLDLGSGAGFDCFLAAEAVGSDGWVVGVDMTPEMVERARENVETNHATNVEFRLGEIEHLPVADDAVDVVVSNCVVNLSADKPQVFREAARVLRPGGRLAISDVVLTATPPPAVRADPSSVAACVAGASPIPDLEAMLDEAGFVGVSVEPKDGSEAFIREWDDDYDPSDFVVAATITGRLPRA